MDFPEPLKKLWSAWEIRILILCSLLLQALLLILAPLRKGKWSKYVRPFIWAFYLLADSFAGLVLGNLINAQGGDSECENPRNNIEQSICSSNSELMTFWGPFLLLHLGGPDTITAFALEDNELWLRHLLWLIFNVFTTSYLLARALPMRRLLAPMLLILLAGIIKYGERTRALYLASMDVFKDSAARNTIPNYPSFMEEFVPRAEFQAYLNRPQEEERSAQQFEPLDNIKVVEAAHHFFKTFKGLIANLLFSVSLSRFFFLRLCGEDAFKVVDVELGFIYDVLYTKAVVVHSVIGYVLRGICSCSIWASLLLFTFTKKHNYKKFDRGITYALLIGTIAMDVIAFIMLSFSNWTIVSLGSTRLRQIVSIILGKCPFLNRPRWSESISQYNLIDFCLIERPKHVNWIVQKLSIGEFLDYLQYTSRASVTKNLKDFIFDELKRKSEFAKDSTTTQMVCSCRGNWVLKDTDFQDLLGWSIEKEFDESLLLWHIATDLCYNNDKGTSRYKEISKNISNYMLYLLVMQPSITSSIAGIGLIRFRDTCAVIKYFFRKEKSRPTLERARKILISLNTEVEPLFTKGSRTNSVLVNALWLTKLLHQLPEDKKWRIISEVWVEMLSYTASHFRGVFHITPPSRGGEMLIFVRFLMVHLGLREQFTISAQV